MQSKLVLRGRNPDVLTCMANLSNDEVSTPPNIANLMLDTLAVGWAEANGGENIWENDKVRFLDPCTKSGVFLREITTRLIQGLSNKYPNLDERVNHILTKQVFGIGITKLTGLIARRSVYCSKDAMGEHSIAKQFTTHDGNIWYERMEHTWTRDKCVYCGANRRDYDRGETLESHAYAFIHTRDISSSLASMFGGIMQFDVIIGNPPYQLGQSGGDSVGGFAMPIYQEFVRAAKSLDPRFLVMITPSRWFAGGRGLEEFRSEMLSDRRLKRLVDYPNASEVFPGVEIKGGVSYFLWDAAWNGKCAVSTVSGGSTSKPLERYLDQWDVLVRRNEAVSILEKVLKICAEKGFSSLAERVSPIQPFSIRTNFRGAKTAKGVKRPVLLYQNGGTSFIARDEIPRNDEWVDDWKVLLPNASGSGNDPQVLGKPIVAAPNSACTETYLVINRFKTEEEAQRFALFVKTRFVRFLVSLRKYTQHIYNERFQFVPDVPMNKEWTDALLVKTFGLTSEEVAFIESIVGPME